MKTQDWPTIAPLLVHMQANLDGDLSLSALSRKAGLSPFHLQRIFKATTGETPKSLASRLRVERAAFQLLVCDATVFEIALQCGFQNHETFIRAFRRRYGVAPGQYRAWVRAQSARQQDDDSTTSVETEHFSLSETRLVRLHSLHLATLRHTGPYEQVPESLFDELAGWAAQFQLAAGPPIWMGIGYDSPVTTPAAQLRFDAALVVPAPFAPHGRIVHQKFEGGEFAVTTHAGPYSTLPQAYLTAFSRAASLPDHQLVGLPAVEIYHTVRVQTSHQFNSTDVCLPVASRRG